MLYNKYKVTKTDGTPTDPDAEYFVLRVDNDPHTWLAMLSFAKTVSANGNTDFANQIITWIFEIAQPKCPECNKALTYKYPTPALGYCSSCDAICDVYWSDVVNLALNNNKERTYEIWSEGYAATGERGGAWRIGISEGENFKEAVLNYFKENPEKKERLLFDESTLRCWGCTLYPSEKEARKSFG